MNGHIRHLLGISGGKDSAALAIYMRDKYPDLPIDYYTCDTGKELDETYQLIENLEAYLGKTITRLVGATGSTELPFDHFLKMYGGYLPSSTARWCTKKLKLEPFEKYVGDDNVISYVGIRGDEEREGYISHKKNIQSIFPFRKNIWSEDIIESVLSNTNYDLIIDLYLKQASDKFSTRFKELLSRPITHSFTQQQKLNMLLDTSTKEFNHLVFSYLSHQEYPITAEIYYPVIDNEDILNRYDIFRILEESGVGVPEYYKKVDFNINGKTGQYSRSRSGCFFCFYQQKIEWVWLYEQHPDLFAKAQEYEKAGYTWMQEETLEDLIQPQRMEKIKEDFIKRTDRKKQIQSPYLLDILEDAEGEGCTACFI